MNASNVVSLDSRREQVQINRRMAQTALTLIAAIKDARLNRYDLELLAKLLELSSLSGLIRQRYEPENRCIVRSLDKLQRAGYLTQATVKDLVIGFRRNGDRTPEPFWVFQLTERELARGWL